MDFARKSASELSCFDTQELLSLVELVQLAFVLFCILIAIVYIIDNGKYDQEEEIRRFKSKSIFSAMGILFIRVLLYCFIYYYVLKIVKVIPSIPALLWKPFTVHQNLDVVIDIVLLVLLIGLSDFIGIPMQVLSDKIVKC